MYQSRNGDRWFLVNVGLRQGCVISLCVYGWCDAKGVFQDACESTGTAVCEWLHVRDKPAVISNMIQHKWIT